MSLFKNRINIAIAVVITVLIAEFLWVLQPNLLVPQRGVVVEDGNIQTELLLSMPGSVSVNRLFGQVAAPEPETEAERLAREALELKNKELEEERKKMLLRLGPDKVRLFGVTKTTDRKYAVITVDSPLAERAAYPLQEGDEIVLGEAVYTIKLVEIKRISTILKIAGEDADESLFELVLFDQR